MHDHHRQPAQKKSFLPATWRGGYFHAPQQIRELLKRERVSGAIQMQIILEVNGEQGRQGDDGTLGEWATGITAPRLATACGRRKDQLSGVEKALADLLKRGLIEREPQGKTWLKGDVVQARSWRYRINPNSWHTAPKCPGPPEDQPAAEETLAESIKASTIVMMPGRWSKVLTLGTAVQKVRLKGDLAADCQVAIAAGGQLEITVSAKQTAVARTEAPAPQVPVPATKPAPDHRTGVRKSETPRKEASEELKAFLDAEVVPLVGAPIPRAILEATAAKLDTAPIEYLADRIRARRGAYRSHGLLPALARDARERYALASIVSLPAVLTRREDPGYEPRWPQEGSWLGDKSHWRELSEEARVLYRMLFPEETLVLDRAKSAGGE